MASSNNLDALFADGELPFGHPGRRFDDTPEDFDQSPLVDQETERDYTPDEDGGVVHYGPGDQPGIGRPDCQHCPRRRQRHHPYPHGAEPAVAGRHPQRAPQRVQRLLRTRHRRMMTKAGVSAADVTVQLGAEAAQRVLEKLNNRDEANISISFR